MKYRVIGGNKETGARMVLEFEAESKAAAERKANQQGMAVSRVEDITDGHAAHAYETGDRSKKASGGMRKMVRRAIEVVVIVVILYLVWTNRGRFM